MGGVTSLRENAIAVAVVDDGGGAGASVAAASLGRQRCSTTAFFRRRRQPFRFYVHGGTGKLTKQTRQHRQPKLYAVSEPLTLFHGTTPKAHLSTTPSNRFRDGD